MLQGINKHGISRKAGHDLRFLARAAPSRPQPLWTSSKYLHEIDEKELLFVGETDNGDRICIKFVRRYSKAVHEKCAEMGTAPKLRDFEDIGRQGISTLP